MHTNRLTSTLSLASRRDPVARLALTTAGSSCGVMPTAIASENSTESITGLRSSRLLTKIEHRQRDRDLQQQVGEPAQPDLKVGFGLPFTQTGCDAPELGVSAGGVHHPGPLAGADDRAHERQIGGVGQLGIGGHGLRRLLRARRFAGQDAFVAFQAG